MDGFHQRRFCDRQLGVLLPLLLLPYAPIFLEVGSTVDGVTSWTTFDAHGDFIESANEASANPCL